MSFLQPVIEAGVQAGTQFASQVGSQAAAAAPQVASATGKVASAAAKNPSFLSKAVGAAKTAGQVATGALAVKALMSQPDMPKPVKTPNPADTENRLNDALRRRLQAGGRNSTFLSSTVQAAGAARPTLTGLTG